MRADFPIGEELWVDIVLGFTVSAAGEGMIQVWVDGTQEYIEESINFGFGTFNDDDTMNPSYNWITFKLGQYNHDDTNWVSGEERIVRCALPASSVKQFELLNLYF